MKDWKNLKATRPATPLGSRPKWNKPHRVEEGTSGRLGVERTRDEEEQEWPGRVFEDEIAQLLAGQNNNSD